MTQTAEAMVIGGGPAGAACAAWLGRAGRQVVLLERERKTSPKVCGEFLSWEAVHYLAALDIDVMALGAVPIDMLRISAGRHVAEARLPFTAMSISRHVLDEVLLRRAATDGADVRRGARVKTLEPIERGWRARLRGGETYETDAAFLATGKHDLRGWPRSMGSHPDVIGFKMHWQLEASQAAALRGCVELILFPGGYAGLQPVETGHANFCLLVQQRRFASLGRTWDNLVEALRSASPLLDARLTRAVPCWNEPLAIGSIPLGYTARAPAGLWRIGDQAAVAPSFTGEGISIALYSARMAAEFYLSRKTAEAFQFGVADALEARLRRATWLSRLLMRRDSQRCLIAMARFAPWLTSRCVSSTRLPPAALRRTSSSHP